MIRWGRRVTLGLCAVIFCYGFAAVLGGWIAGPSKPVPSGADETDIHLIAGPIHYDNLLPLNAQTHAALGWLVDGGVDMHHPNARWLAVGWGAREFYTTTGTYRDVSARAIWKALSGDRSVMHVGLAGTLDADIGTRVLRLSRPEYSALLQAITATFADGVETRVLPTPGFSDHDRFFPARGRFHLFNTCNVWIGEVLRAAGLRFGAWTPLPYAVSIAAFRHQPAR